MIGRYIAVSLPPFITPYESAMTRAVTTTEAR